MVESSPRRTTVAVLDYPGPSMPARTKSVLISDGRLTCSYPLDEHRPCTTALSEYVSAVANRISAPPDVIVAYCAAATIARELAGRYPVPPRLVLINPELPEIENSVTAFVSLLTEDAAAIEPDVRRTAESWLANGADRDQVLEALTDRHQARLEREFDAPQPHLRPIAGQLAEMQVQWIYHLAAAADSARGTAKAEELHLISADHPCEPDCAAVHEAIGESVDEIFSGQTLADAIVTIGSSPDTDQ